MQFLSYTLGESTPGYGGQQGFFEKKVRDMSCGDTCNAAEWRLSNHIGTHIDSPLHFHAEGASVDSYSADSWFFNHVCLLDFPLEPGMIIETIEVDAIPVTTELLLVRTGFEKFRSESVYWESNPGWSPEVATILKKRAPKLRAIGFDFISLTSYQHRELGRAAHRSFLGDIQGQGPLLIIEDMKLAGLQKSPKQVIVLPLRVEGADGAPVTVVAID